MTTTFELLISGQEFEYARQVSEEVWLEINHFEDLLSRFDPRSDISQLNRLRPGEAVRVSWEVVECLEMAVRAWSETQGAFDPSFRTPGGSAMGRLWLSRPGIGPNGEQLEFAAGLLPLEEGQEDPLQGGMELDLGAIGKGYALDRVVEVLNDWGVEQALIHSGTSTVLALDPPAGQSGWVVGVGGPWGKAIQMETTTLKRQALSGSGTEVKGEHVIDPRQGAPSSTHVAAWALCPSAGFSDALSTAFMVMETEQVEAYCQAHPDVSALVVPRDPRKMPVRFGEWPG